MAGIYLGTAVTCLWAGITVQRQGVLVYLLALGVLLAGTGRLEHFAKRLNRAGIPANRSL